MSASLLVAIPLAVVVVSLVAVFRVTSTMAAWVGCISALSMAVLVPSFSTSAAVAAASVLGSILVLAIALLRDRPVFSRIRIPYVLIGFILWSTVVGSFGAPMALVLLYVATGVLLILLVLAVIRAVEQGHNVYLPFFAVVLVFEFVVGFGEEFLGTHAMWPRADGTDNISHRVNEVIPLLVGRAMGSTSQPIPYGMLLGACVVVCLWFAARSRSKLLWVLAGIGLVGMLFAGTRSSFVALAVVLVFWAVMTVKWRPLTILLTVSAVVALALIGGVLLLSAGNWSVLNTASFLHRAGVLSTSGNLLTRSPVDVIFGSGYASVETLMKTGVVHGVPGIYVFDEEFIRTLACLGIVGLVVLVTTFVRGIVVGDQLSRLLIVFLALSFLSFDGYSWRLIACLFVVTIAHGYGDPRGTNFTLTELRRLSLRSGLERIQKVDREVAR